MKLEILIDSKSDALAALQNAEVKISSAIRSMPKAELDKHDLQNALALIEAAYDWIHKQVHGEFDEELDEADAELEEEGSDRRGIDGNLKAYLCTVCHRECVDAPAGFDTCPRCLKERI